MQTQENPKNNDTQKELLAAALLLTGEEGVYRPGKVWRVDWPDGAENFEQAVFFVQTDLIFHDGAFWSNLEADRVNIEKRPGYCLPTPAAVLMRCSEGGADPTAYCEAFLLFKRRALNRAVEASHV